MADASHPMRHAGAPAQAEWCKRETDGHLPTAVDRLSEAATMMRNIIAAARSLTLRPAFGEISSALADLRSIAADALPSLDIVARIEDQLVAVSPELAVERRSRESRSAA